MTNDVIRGSEVVHSSKSDVFEFNQQGAFFVQQEPYEVKPGDAWKTSCYFRDGDKFGLSSQEEMCIAYVIYYPAKKAGGVPWMCPYNLGIPICSQELGQFDIQDVQGLDRVFGTSNGSCTVTGATETPTAGGPTLAPDSGSGRAGINAVFFATLISASFLCLAGGL